MPQPPPDLPPMLPPSPSPQPERLAPVQSQPMQQGVPLGRRLRQLVTVVASGGLLMMFFLVALQLIAKPGLRPTDIMATVEAQTELGIFNQRMGAESGEIVMNEGEYREKIAEAERTGQAKAELAFQKDLAVVQADKERVVGAYTTLFQRANLIAQAAINLETIAQEFRQRLVESSNAGRNAVIMWKDIFCGFGSKESCASAKSDREVLFYESEEYTSGDVGAKIRELMQGIDDPATFITHADQARNGTPALQRD